MELLVRFSLFYHLVSKLPPNRKLSRRLVATTSASTAATTSTASSSTTTAAATATLATITIVATIISTSVVSATNSIASAITSPPRRARSAAGTARAGGARSRSSAATTGIQIPSQLPRDWLQVHKVAEAGAGALAHLVLPAACLTKIGDGRQLGIYWSTAEPAVVQIVRCLLGISLVPELDVNVTHEVVTQIIANVHLFNFAILVLALHEHILEEVVIMFLHLLIGDVGHQMRSIRRLGGILRVDVQILEKYCLREGWFVVDPRAPIAVAAGANLKVKRAVDSARDTG